MSRRRRTMSAGRYYRALTMAYVLSGILGYSLAGGSWSTQPAHASVVSAGKPTHRHLTATDLYAYRVTVKQVTGCFAAMPPVQPAVHAMLGVQHMYTANYGSGPTPESHERDTLKKVGIALGNACRARVVIGSGRVIGFEDHSMHDLFVTLNTWLTASSWMGYNMMTCAAPGGDAFYSPTCIPPLVKELGPYLKSYTAARVRLRAFRVYWGLAK